MTVPFIAPAINGDKAIKISTGVILNLAERFLAILPILVTSLKLGVDVIPIIIMYQTQSKFILMTQDPSTRTTPTITPPDLLVPQHCCSITLLGIPIKIIDRRNKTITSLRLTTTKKIAIETS